jgi:hypothetical protein
VLPLDFVHRAPSLNHGHESSWWRERLLFVSWLPWLALLDCSGLVTLLDHVCWWIRRWWWSVVSYRTGHRLLGRHSLLKRLTETKEFSALDEEVSGSLNSIFVEVRVPCAPSIKHLFCSQLWLIASLAPLSSWLQITASAPATTAIVVVPSSWTITIVIAVLVYIACCYHVRGLCVVIAVPTPFFAGAIVKLILCIAITLHRSPAASRCQNRVFTIIPLVCQAHEMVDHLRLAAP